MSSIVLGGCINRVSTDDLLVDVLNNKHTFIDESNQQIYLKDYKFRENKDIEIMPKKYALIDFDKDGTNELVVYVSQNYGAYMIFHMHDEKIYGFEFLERAMIDLKTDGVFVQSDGAGINAYSRLSFNKNKYQVSEDAYSNEMDNIYRVNGEKSTREQVNAYTQSFDKKESVAWKQISN